MQLYSSEQMFPAAEGPLAADQRTGFERMDVTNVVDDVVDELLW